MSEPVYTSETPPEPASGEPTPAPDAPAQESQSWDELFKGEDPAKVRQALADSRRWEQRAKENKAAADRLKEIEDRDLSELQKVQRDREELAARLAEVEREAVRNRVALAKRLEPDIAGLIKGDTEEELAAHADVLLAWRGNVPPSTPRPDPGQGPRPSTPQAEMDAEYAQYAQKLFPGLK